MKKIIKKAFLTLLLAATLLSGIPNQISKFLPQNTIDCMSDDDPIPEFGEYMF